jgi:hypothetical protein
VAIKHFKCSDDSNTHQGWCTAEGCFVREEGEGRRGAARLRRWARKHVEDTGHEVRIDVSRQHGYRAISS